MSVLAKEELARRGYPPLGDSSSDDTFRPDPDDVDVAFTKVLHASVDGQRVKKANWNRVLRAIHEAAFRKAGSFKALAAITRANIEQGQPNAELLEHGYTYIESGDFSLQGMDANQAWMTIRDMARQLDLPVEIDFEWRDKEGVEDVTNRGRKARLSHSPTK